MKNQDPTIAKVVMELKNLTNVEVSARLLQKLLTIPGENNVADGKGHVVWAWRFASIAALVVGYLVYWSYAREMLDIKHLYGQYFNHLSTQI
jgi:hypothetical protein